MIIMQTTEHQASQQALMAEALGPQAAASSTQPANKGKVAVIGAGPAGLSCALELLKAGYAVDIFELDDKVGGISRTIEVLGQRADLGPHHFLSNIEAVQRFWHVGMRDDDFLTAQRFTRILYNGKFFSYPLKGFDALFKLGFLESVHCVLSYAYAALFPRKEPTFEAWVSNAFGQRLYEIFFKTYSERLWGIKCSELSDQFAKQRIKTLNLRKAIVHAVLPQRHPSATPRSLAGEFIYPRLGSGMVYEHIAQEVERLGGRFFFKHKVVGLTTAPITSSEVVPSWANNAANEQRPDFTVKVTGIVTQELAAGQGAHASNAPVPQLPASEPVTRSYDFVVSSGIFSEVVSSLKALPTAVQEQCARLRFRNTLLVFLTIDPTQAQLCPDHWLYVHSPEIMTGRMCDFANWSPEMQQGHKDHLIAFEYWANDDDELWNKSDDELMAQARVDAAKSGFISAEAITGTAVHRIYKSYPVYFNGYESILAAITSELDKVANLYFIGRNGSYKYNNMDHSVLMGLFCAQKIAGKYHGSLWAINTDSNYQELKAQA